MPTQQRQVQHVPGPTPVVQWLRFGAPHMLRIIAATPRRATNCRASFFLPV